MTQDRWSAARGKVAMLLRNPLVWLADILFFAAVFYLYYMEAVNPSADLAIHASIAKDFQFTDLHSITSRIAYPLWHIAVSAAYQLGLPIAVAAAAVTALMKTLFFKIAQFLMIPAKGQGNRAVMWVMCLILMIVTGIRLPWVNPLVYRAAGSPTVWHNPTQITVTMISLLCVPYLVHCWCLYERRSLAGEAAITMPWRNVFGLAALLMLAAAAKPTFLQGLIPAAFVLFLWQWLAQPRQWRYFGQLVLAFLPSVLYFLLQYLYYTGVVVEYTSGVSVYVTPETLWIAIRSVFILNAFPLAALLLRIRKRERIDRAFILVLLMMLFSALEAAFFHETGMRENHGNFTWATGSSSLLFWWLTLSSFWGDFTASWKARSRQPLRACGYAVAWALLGWHTYSAIYYLYYLCATRSAF